MARYVYKFEWDPAKATANLDKHGVAFERAAQIFQDPLALTIPDAEHSHTEERWITLGREASHQYILVVHTVEELTSDSMRIRLISARRPTKAEIRAYEEKQ